MNIEDEYAAACAAPSDMNEHLPTLRRYAEQCQSVTEFGVRTGLSTIAFMAAKPVRLRSYDVFSDDGVAERFHREQADGNDFQYIIENVLKVGIDETDLLFIDTWHAFDQIIRELMVHSRQVRRWIIMHDTETFGLRGEEAYGLKPSNGLLAGIAMFLLHNPHWRVKEHYPNSHGLTVLQKG